MNELTITTLITSIFVFLIVPLSMQITMKRIKLGNIAIGDGNNDDLRKKIETLGNFSEYVPLGLILLAVFEYKFGSTMSVAFYGGVFLLCRVIHLIGMLYTSTPLLRAIAMIVQHISFFIVGGTLIYTIVLP